MYKLPGDLENELQRKFPNVHIRKMIDSIFRMIVEKSLKDGSCFIKEFGHFSSYGKWSTKMERKVIRFRFKITPSLEKKIKTDQYYIDNIPIKAKSVFSEEHEEVCKDKKAQREANAEAEKEAEKLGKERTKKQIVVDEITNIVNELEKSNK